MAERIAWDEEFTLGPEGPYGPQYDNAGRPISTLGALKIIEAHLPDHYDALKRAWNVAPETDVEGLAERIGRQIRVVDSLNADPVRVWATADGKYKVSVYRGTPYTRQVPSRTVAAAQSRARQAAQPAQGAERVWGERPPAPAQVEEEPEDLTQQGYLIAVILNPKTLQPCLAYYSSASSQIYITTPEGKLVGTGYFDSDQPAGDKYRVSEVSGYPRAHTPKGVTEMGSGYGTVLYAALAAAAHLNSEQDLDLELSVDGDGISSNVHRSASANAWWDAAKRRHIAFAETIEIDREQIEEFGLEEELDREEEFETSLSPHRPGLRAELEEALEYEDDIYPTRIDRVEVEGTQAVRVDEYITEADILPFERPRDRYGVLGVKNIVLAVCNFPVYELPLPAIALKRPADFEEESVLDFNDDAAKLLNLQGIGFTVLVTIAEIYRLAGKNKLFERLQEEALGTPMGYLLENPARSAEQRKVYEKLQIADYASLPD